MEFYAVGGMLAFAVVLMTYSLWPGHGDEKGTVLRRVAGKAKQEKEQTSESAIDQAAKSLMTRLAPLAMKPVMPKSDEEMSMLRVRLANAGFRDESAAGIFLASKTLAAVGLAVTAIILTYDKGWKGVSVFGLAAILGVVGFLLPEVWLWAARRKRGQAIRHGLPDSLDLMVISVEAGLGLDAAIQRVGDEMAHVHPTLSEELTITTLETQMGLPRSEALSNLASRSGVPEVRSLVAVVTQAEKFGTSVARALRNQADALRVKRRQAAEERAQKTTVKLMLPLVLFIFPAIFVVLGAPAALKFIDAFKGSGGLGGF
jgi:tight adherence protein C